MSRGPEPKYRIVLTTEQEQSLRQLINSRKAAQGQVLRARIIVTAHDHPDWSNQQIARTVGCTDRAVRKWRRRWNETQNLADLPRPGAPRRFSPRGQSSNHAASL